VLGNRRIDRENCDHPYRPCHGHHHRQYNQSPLELLMGIVVVMPNEVDD
jgi:hypothetical protein